MLSVIGLDDCQLTPPFFTKSEICLPQSCGAMLNLVLRSRHPRKLSLSVLVPLVFPQLFIFSGVVTHM